jgi:hypothetical protein
MNRFSLLILFLSSVTFVCAEQFDKNRYITVANKISIPEKQAPPDPPVYKTKNPSLFAKDFPRDLKTEKRFSSGGHPLHTNPSTIGKKKTFHFNPINIQQNPNNEYSKSDVPVMNTQFSNDNELYNTIYQQQIQIENLESQIQALANSKATRASLTENVRSSCQADFQFFCQQNQFPVDSNPVDETGILYYMDDFYTGSFGPYEVDETDLFYYMDDYSYISEFKNSFESVFPYESVSQVDPIESVSQVDPIESVSRVDPFESVSEFFPNDGQSDYNQAIHDHKDNHDNHDNHEDNHDNHRDNHDNYEHDHYGHNNNNNHDHDHFGHHGHRRQFKLRNLRSLHSQEKNQQPLNKLGFGSFDNDKCMMSHIMDLSVACQISINQKIESDELSMSQNEANIYDDQDKKGCHGGIAIILFIVFVVFICALRRLRKRFLKMKKFIDLLYDNAEIRSVVEGIVGEPLPPRCQPCCGKSKKCFIIKRVFVVWFFSSIIVALFYLAFGTPIEIVLTGILSSFIQLIVLIIVISIIVKLCKCCFKCFCKRNNSNNETSSNNQNSEYPGQNRLLIQPIIFNPNSIPFQYQPIPTNHSINEHAPYDSSNENIEMAYAGIPIQPNNP